MSISDAIAAARTAVAAVNDESTDAEVMAADAAVAAAMKAIDDATHISAGEAATNRASLATISGQLDTAKSSRTMTMTVASERMAISAALAAAMTAVEAVMDDSEDSVVTAAEEAIAAATAAINAAGHLLSSETMAEHAKVAALRTTLDEAKMSRQMAMDAAEEERQRIATENARRAEQRMAITSAIDAARTAVGMVTDTSSDEQVAAADAAVAKARMAIADAELVSDDDKAVHTASVDEMEQSLTSAKASRQTAMAASQKLADQRMAISDAIAEARMAVAGVTGTSTDDEVDAAERKVAAAREVIAGQDAVPDAEKDANRGIVSEIETQLAAAKKARTDAIAARDQATAAENAAMMATALKLHTGISAPMGDPASPAATDRAAAYDTDATAIMVSIGNGTDTPTAVSLSEDKKTRVPANHDWDGKRYARTTPAAEGMYEATVYSNVGDPTMGEKFNAVYPNTAAFVTDGVVTIDTTGTDTPASRVASPRFDQRAGTKTFKLPENTVAVKIPGSFHGVSGTYSCTPVSGGSCTATIAAAGFTLAGVDGDGAEAAATVWTFTPTNAEARVTEMEDMIYASYGWWIHKSADDKTYTASAFVSNKGAVPAAAGIDDLRGTATYMGGAAGKYALHSSTGGTNDAGHFTARATLEADFNDDMVTGTIDQFMGADGESRNWSVELKESMIGAAGPISSDGTANGAGAETVWTIDGTAAAAAGRWSGTLYDNGDDDVPKVATGTFYSTYSTAGKMVGAFGVTKQ